jgi:hypothetical protein
MGAVKCTACNDSGSLASGAACGCVRLHEQQERWREQHKPLAALPGRSSDMPAVQGHWDDPNAAVRASLLMPEG